MRVEAEIKEVGAPYQGTARVTGKAWKSMQLLLEWEDEDGSSQAGWYCSTRLWRTLCGKGCKRGIAVWQTCSSHRAATARDTTRRTFV